MIDIQNSFISVERGGALCRDCCTNLPTRRLPYNGPPASWFENLLDQLGYESAYDRRVQAHYAAEDKRFRAELTAALAAQKAEGKDHSKCPSNVRGRVVGINAWLPSPTDRSAE